MENQIGVLTSLLSIVFTARCVLVLLDMFYLVNQMESIISKIVYQIAFEFVPGKKSCVMDSKTYL